MSSLNFEVIYSHQATDYMSTL